MSTNNNALSNWNFLIILFFTVAFFLLMLTNMEVEDIKQEIESFGGSEFLLYSLDETGNPPVPLRIFAIESSPLALHFAIDLIPKGTRILVDHCEEYGEVPFETVEFMWGERGEILRKCRLQGLALHIYPP